MSTLGIGPGTMAPHERHLQIGKRQSEIQSLNSVDATISFRDASEKRLLRPKVEGASTEL